MYRIYLGASGLALSLVVTAHASVPAGDAASGALHFKTLGCISCHAVNGEGGRSAPDLARGISRSYTPDDLAAAFWNHAPVMWPAMAGKTMPKMREDQAADMFAFFYAARFFDAKGDPVRGKKLYVEKGCAGCHNLSSANAAGGRPVINWESVADPVELARQMWNHAPSMRAAMAKTNKPIPKLSSTDINDITDYLRNLPQTKGIHPQATFASAQTGEKLFELKGCAGCHSGENSLTRATGFRSANDVAAAMWNHAALMKVSSPLRPEEMTRIAGYVWSLQFGLPTGNVESGRRLWESKGCSGCHAGQPPASVTGSEGNAYCMVAATWNHGPQMAEKIKANRSSWPKLNGEEMTNLLTWLGTIR